MKSRQNALGRIGRYQDTPRALRKHLSGCSRLQEADLIRAVAQKMDARPHDVAAKGVPALGPQIGVTVIPGHAAEGIQDLALEKSLGGSRPAISFSPDGGLRRGNPFLGALVNALAIGQHAVAHHAANHKPAPFIDQSL